jgi:ribosomal protein L11 methyltransferase
LVIAELGAIGFESFAETDKGFTAYLKKSDFDQAAMEHLIAHFTTDCAISWSAQEIPATNWNSQWESSFKPVTVGKHCIVKAPFHHLERSAKYIIELTPKMSFGTGHHQTTYLMLKKMLDMDIKDRLVLDMGCGTAVLAILAKKMGAAEVLAIDNDHWAYHNSLENVALNQCSDIMVELGAAANLADRAFNIILANINKNILLEDIKRYNEALLPGGILLMSGFFTQDVDAIEEAAKQCGLSRTAYDNKDNWATLQFTKS